ncbi:hypothetical protein D3C84_426130 [compost metagenome]
MGKGRDRGNPEAGAAGPRGLRREPAGPDAHAFLPDLHPSGPGHAADGRVLRRGPARRGNGAARPGPDGRPRGQPRRGPGSADAGHPAAATLPRPHPERSARPADGPAAAAQRPACRPRRQPAVGNQPVRTGPLQCAAGAVHGHPGAHAHRRAAGAAAQTAADAAGRPGGRDPQSGSGRQPRLHGAGLRPPRIPLPGRATGPALADCLGSGGRPGQWQRGQRFLGAQPAAPGGQGAQAPAGAGRGRLQPGGPRRAGEEPVVLHRQGPGQVTAHPCPQGAIPAR